MGVIDLEQKRLERTPHMQGPCRCMQCGHKWRGVAPVGVRWLECPNCHAEKGYFITETMPPEDTLIWKCNCGEYLFVVLPDGSFMCIECGVQQRFP